MAHIATKALVIFLLLSPCFAQDSNPQARFAELREQAFDTTANDLGVKVSSPTEPFCVILDIGFPEMLVTLVSFKNQTAALYGSHGNQVLAGPEQKELGTAVKNFIMVSKDYVHVLTKTRDHPLPEIGKVSFYMLTDSGIFASEQLDEKELKDGAHPLSGLFYLGSEVYAAIQKLEKKQ